ncbi:hypothetical protein ACVWWI_006372 [Bradyrhizobium sp. USDA 3686]|nr:hypothetical protein [Bradyrhizobium canariense]
MHDNTFRDNKLAKEAGPSAVLAGNDSRCKEPGLALFVVTRTGSELRARNPLLSRYTGSPVISIDATLAAKAASTASPSSRATICPTQPWIPVLKPICPETRRVMSNWSGRSHRVSSRFAERACTLPRGPQSVARLLQANFGKAGA